MFAHADPWWRWFVAPALAGFVALAGCGDAPTGNNALDDASVIASHGTNGGETTVDLVAAQDEVVGEVHLSDDGTDLNVHLVITEADWCLTEVHIDAADDEDGIPTNKKGNPQPGHFEINEELDCETEFEADLSLTGLSDDIVVAVHAVVQKSVRTLVFQIGDEEIASEFTGDNSNCAGDCSGLTLLENYSDELNQPDPNGPHTLGPNLGTVAPAFDDPFVVGTSADADFPYNSNAKLPYATDFDVQWDGELPSGGELTISWSPGNSAFETKTVSGDGITSTTFTSTGSKVLGEGWFLNQYKLVESTVSVGALPSGTHTINFTHTTGDGTFWDWVRLESLSFMDETAWGDGERFVDQGNWATFIEYTVEE